MPTVPLPVVIAIVALLILAELLYLGLAGLGWAAFWWASLAAGVIVLGLGLLRVLRRRGRGARGAVVFVALTIEVLAAAFVIGVSTARLALWSL